MSFELRAGEQSLAETVAYAPYDSLGDLINALVELLNHDTEQTVKWSHEPDELDFNFSANGDEAKLEVNWYRDASRTGMTGERVFIYAGTRLDVCYPFWQALRDLQADIEVDEFARNWRREFPAHEMLRLNAGIEAHRLKAAQSAKQFAP